jgi:hypothetical protein
MRKQDVCLSHKYKKYVYDIQNVGLSQHYSYQQVCSVYIQIQIQYNREVNTEDLAFSYHNTNHIKLSKVYRDKY